MKAEEKNIRLPIDEKERERMLDKVKKQLKEFTADFDGIREFPLVYGQASIQPNTGHPRIWVNEETLGIVKANLSDPENVKVYEEVKARADAAVGESGEFRIEPGNYKERYLYPIEALAFMYLITGDKAYGYSAILQAFNLLKCVVFNGESIIDAYNDNHNAGYSFYIMAEVYDWCHDLFTSDQLELFVRGACSKLATKMEIGYPPMKLGCITGHGVGSQILRHWLAFAIAVADEYPDIYNNVVGRILSTYLEAPNWHYSSGAEHQGSGYGPDNVAYQVMAESLMYTATGVKIYDISFEEVIINFIHRWRPDNEAIRVGDDMGGAKVEYGRRFLISALFFAGSYYKNATAKAWCKHLAGEDFKGVEEWYVGKPLFLILNDPSVSSDKDDQYKLPLVHSSRAPFTTVEARSAWNDPDAWLTYTNMEEAYASNHDHMDSGTFQIYYKGILAPDTGVYQYTYYQGNLEQTYGGVYDYTYVKQTISKNGLLIYNPELKARADSDPDEWFTENCKYSGGQSIFGDTGEYNSLEQWKKSGNTERACTLGKSHKIENGALEYSYIAGDITRAYDKESVDLVTRATMTLATRDPENPMMFIVYDRIKAKDPSFKKTFLLHTTNKPVFASGDETVSEPYSYINGANSFYYDNTLGASGAYDAPDPEDKYNGRLTVKTLLPEHPVYAVIGGDGKRFIVNGEQVGKEIGEKDGVLHTPKTNKAAEIGWGRVEINTSGNETDSFLNVMYVSDADKEVCKPCELVITETHEGILSCGCAVLFAKSPEPVKQISFSLNAEGLTRCYIGGVACGEWTIEADGFKLGSYKVTDDEKLLLFDFESKKHINAYLV